MRFFLEVWAFFLILLLSIIGGGTAIYYAVSWAFEVNDLLGAATAAVGVSLMLAFFAWWFER